MGDTPWRIDPTTHRTMGERSYHGATSRSLLTRKQGMCLFDDALNTFYLRLYGKLPLSERGNPYGLLFRISIDIIAHIMSFVTLVVEHNQNEK